ncbi:Fasciclin-domain-containing protein [Basidiobolus meristosporus CBS 931.73]|uniref:Fasciclin-domain-containing protein n=1 Tax=Basidiobolus meristosporus CBS 931.73 TaxID=1314790 RepID=A0A1Y1XHY0_9FUNG|nr:Fasciclin-domain-containing protein [Basidiobolus meristosporus CBS 931.73]|eukprot:ORX84976.1 Fasciclin-domain-containing protein [Basidiobolus meristosporus CBS 931.73]
MVHLSLVHFVYLCKVYFIIACSSQRIRFTLQEAIDSDSTLTTFSALTSLDITRPIADLLVGLEEYTIFAPTDEAFDSTNLGLGLTNDTVDLLRYHIVRGRHHYADLQSNPQFLPTILNSTVVNDKQYLGIYNRTAASARNKDTKIEVTDGKKRGKIATEEIETGNGIILKIDRVLTPPATLAKSLHRLNLTAFSNILSLSGLASTLEHTQNLTVFAPTNEALSKTSLSDVKSLEAFVRNHVVSSRIYSRDLQDGYSIWTESRMPMLIRRDSQSNIYIDNVKILQSDRLLSNGVLYVVNSPIEPGQPLYTIGLANRQSAGYWGWLMLVVANILYSV